ncbi:sensor histidine kinase [Leucobacter denitrificans]|uniref:histidine kinase n=2 Tax=Leucobacter denitrificans TaxID=683042 RepID=A0A7G9S803_9MICO|nr:sensor histidine kinase [Leucobacter denitrificans]
MSRTLRWWDLACAAVLAFMLIVMLIEGISGAPYWAASLETVLRVALLVAPALLLALLWVTLGRSSLREGLCDLPLSGRSGTFLVLLLLVLALGTATAPMYAMLQAIAYPVVWTIAIDYRGAVLWCLAVATAVGAGMYLGLSPLDPNSALASSLTTALVSLVFSIAMGTWITRIHAQGESYRELAEQLERSQGEVAALSQEAGAAAERERMSRDLHDTLTQTLAGLVMLSEQTERALDAGDESRARDRLARVESAARAAVAEARALVATTQPIGEDGLERAIERVAAALRADTGLEVECTLTNVELAREREVVLLRAVQEGLANARKHAKASRVVITLEPLGDGGARLRVDDDGVGPDADAADPTRGGGFGLTGLADRVRQVEGEARFGARAGGGSRLEVELAPARSATETGHTNSGHTDSGEIDPSERVDA